MSVVKSIYISFFTIGLLGLESCSYAKSNQYVVRKKENARRNLKIEGLDYLKARNIIIEYQWKPVEGACEGAKMGGNACEKYPEIESCSGTGLGYCGMNFKKADKCLLVTTIGGVPSAKKGDVTVSSVSFLNRGCPKTL